jgi:hypothetical protein
MKSTEIHPADYDAQGRVRLPFLFWCVLLLQARTWVLFVMAAASRGQGDTLLNLFIPITMPSGSACCRAYRRWWLFCAADDGMRSRACGARFAGC